MQHVAAHKGNLWNELADVLCKLTATESPGYVSEEIAEVLEDNPSVRWAAIMSAPDVHRVHPPKSNGKFCLDRIPTAAKEKSLPTQTTSLPVKMKMLSFNVGSLKYKSLKRKFDNEEVRGDDDGEGQ